MTALSILLPLLVLWVLALLPLGMGVLALVKTRRDRRRRRWVVVAGLVAVLGGAVVMIQGRAALVGAASDETWFVVLAGLLPIVLGAVSLVRWLRLQASR